MGRLSTHVLDTANGIPAAGVTIELYALKPERVLLTSVVTNVDGRIDQSLLSENEMQSGCYEFCFHIGDYFKNRNMLGDKMAFLDVVPVRFRILNTKEHYHVPLLVSPWSYSTYRGS